MHVSYYYSKVTKGEQDIADLYKKISEETKKEMDKQKSIASVEKSITKNTSPSSYASKMNQIRSYQNDVLRIQGVRADLQKKLAVKTQELNKSKIDLNKAELEDRKKAQREQEEFQSRMRADFDRQQNVIDQIVRPSNITNYIAQVKEYDFFISHATEDKEDFAKPLAERLQQEGFNVWFDQHQLKIGDSLRRKIDEGLKMSKFGIVVLSANFFRKEWPQYELDGLTTREANGIKVILPIWHKVTKQEVINYSPSLAGKIALNTSIHTLDDIVEELKQLF